MTDASDDRRQQVAKALLLVGLGMVLAGTALIVHHRASTAAIPTSQPGQADARSRVEDQAKALRVILFYLPVFAGIFGVSTFAFLRWSRRFRKWVFYEPRPPTPAGIFHVRNR